LSDLLKNSKGYPNTIANWGVDGATSADGAKYINFTLSTLPMAKYYLVMYGTNDARQAVPIPSGKGLKPGEPGYNQSFKSNLQRILSAILAAGKIPYIAKVPFTAWWTIDILIIQDYNVVIDELVVANNIDVGYESMTDLWFQALTR
jgi:lysophospholipase L1-like esterase